MQHLIEQLVALAAGLFVVWMCIYILIRMAGFHKAAAGYNAWCVAKIRQGLSLPFTAIRAGAGAAAKEIRPELGGPWWEKTFLWIGRFPFALTAAVAGGIETLILPKKKK